MGGGWEDRFVCFPILGGMRLVEFAMRPGGWEFPPILNVAIRGDDRRQFGESESLDGAGYDNVNAVIGSGRSLT
jgi:hypothetical protein